MFAHLIAKCTHPWCRHSYKKLGPRGKYVVGSDDMIYVQFDLYVCRKCKKEKEGKYDYGGTRKI